MFRPKEKKRIITCTVHMRKEKGGKRGGVSERESERMRRGERGKKRTKEWAFTSVGIFSNLARCSKCLDISVASTKSMILVLRL